MAFEGFSEQIFKGAIWLGIPLIKFPASRAEIKSPRDIQRHRIPGRDGDIIDDIGSPARTMSLDVEISRGLLEKVLESSINYSITGTPITLAEPTLFMQMIHQWWLSKLEMPVICMPIQTLMQIEDQSVVWEGGHGGRFIIHLDLVERLPFSLSSIAGRLIMGGLFGTYLLAGALV